MPVTLGLIAPHSPRLANEDRVSAPFDLMARGLYALREDLKKAAPDVVVLTSCHFLTTFLLYVNAAPRHAGRVTANECPDLVTSLPYDFPGHPTLARSLAEAARARDIPLVPFDNPDFVLDYGTVVPARYLFGEAVRPLVPVSVSIVGTLEEAVALGETLAEVTDRLGLRAAVVASGALSHRVVRGPDRWPEPAERAWDDRFLDRMAKGQRQLALEFLPEFVQAAHVEAWGKHLGFVLGALPDRFAIDFKSYGPSSGSGNASVAIFPAA
ncbi:MAG: extradiol ring-cleavage dioxygenase [Firmicutes bacterium]|nr:extradiol ring-cleavage dioxygenase [Alicyclobacillaceae bacterium]MCL6497355.1 extradiol ring-cleavage dioxygenase [Bacillota bacterium]